MIDPKELEGLPIYQDPRAKDTPGGDWPAKPLAKSLRVEGAGDNAIYYCNRRALSKRLVKEIRGHLLDTTMEHFCDIKRYRGEEDEAFRARILADLAARAPEKEEGK